MKTVYKIKIIPFCGTDIQYVFKEAWNLVLKTNVEVTFDFNGITITIDPNK